MAMYHLHVRFVKRSEGKSSVAAAAYRAGEKLPDERRGNISDFSHKSFIEHKEILLPEHLPEWLSNRSTLWNTVETGLARKDAQPAFEVEVALPRELDSAQCVQLVRSFAREHFTKQGLIVDLCIHRPKAADGLDHPHAHMLITTRRWNEDGSMSLAARDLQDNPKLLQKIYSLEKEGKIDQALLASKGTNLANWRKSWADYSNDFLEDSGSASRVDHRTLAAQRIDREPIPNIGIAFYREIEGVRGWLAKKVEALKAISWRNTMRGQFERIREKRGDLTAEFVAHAREYASELLEVLEPPHEREAKIDR